MNCLIGSGTVTLVQSVAGGTPMTMTTTGTTEGSQNKQTTLGSAKAAKTLLCLTKRHIDGARRTRARKMLERCGKELGQTTHWRNPSEITMVLRCFQDHHTLQKREGRAGVTHSGRAPSTLGHQWSAHWMTNC